MSVILVMLAMLAMRCFGGGVLGGRSLCARANEYDDASYHWLDREFVRY